MFDQALADKDSTKEIPKTRCRPNYIMPGTDEALLAIYKGKVAATTSTPARRWCRTSGPGLADRQHRFRRDPEGQEAVTVSLDQNHAVGGFVTPGDKVNVILNLPRVTNNAGAATVSLRTTAFLLPGLKVLAVGSSTVLPAQSTTPDEHTGTASTTTAQTQPSSLITLQVTPRQAEQIIQGTTLGTVWLSLNPPGFNPGKFKTPTEIVDEINLFNQPLARAVDADDHEQNSRRQYSVIPGVPLEHRERVVMETSSPSERPGPQRYRVLAVEPDERAADADDPRARRDRAARRCPRVDEATRELVPGEPTVVVFGPSLRTRPGSQPCSASRAPSPRSVSSCSPTSSPCRCCKTRCAPVFVTRSRSTPANARSATRSSASARRSSGLVNRAAAAARTGRQGRSSCLLHQGWRRQERRRDEPRRAARDAQSGPGRARRRRPSVR